MKKVMCSIVMVLIVNTFLFPQDSIKNELSLKDAIVIALKNNLNLQVEMTNTEYYWNDLKVNKSIFIPTLEINGETSATNTPSTSAFAGADITTNERSSLEFKLIQPLVLGGSLEFSLDNSKYETNSIYSTINPSLTTIMTFSITQPLLKNFGILPT